MELGELYGFLLTARLKTWVNGEGKVSEALGEPGAETYMYERGPWFYLDSFHGGESFLGHEIIRHDNRIVWGMNYQGYIIDPEVNAASEIYTLLKEALRVTLPSRIPLRGPKEYFQVQMTYRSGCIWNGQYFLGWEKILRRADPHEILLYSGSFHGGPIRP